MMSRSLKATFYSVAGPAMFLSGAVYRTLRAPRSGDNRVHLGPGRDKYIPGWINVDANIFSGRADVWADLRNLLPFHDGTVDAFYSHHVIEHLPNLRLHFREVIRCLKPGGVYRVGGPNGDSAMRMFVANRSEWFCDFPDCRRSIGGRLENFVFCRGEHLTILTESYLRELMEEAGFGDIRVCRPIHETAAGTTFLDCMKTEFESTPTMPHTLILEGLRVGRSTALLPSD